MWPMEFTTFHCPSCHEQRPVLNQAIANVQGYILLVCARCINRESPIDADEQIALHYELGQLTSFKDL